MGSLSFALVALIFAQLSACSPQVNTPIPITNSAAAPSNTCGGCYVVADVAGIEFGTATITQLQQATVSVGLNHTTVISVQSQIGVTDFSFGPSGVIGSGTLFNYGTAITYSGITLTSPTAYDVFTAYSITSTVFSNGGCSTALGPPVIVSPAFSFARSLGSDGIDEAAEQAFIDHIGGLPTCLPGGVNSVQSTVTPVVIQTSFSTITRALPTPQPIMSATSSTPSSTTASTTTPTSTSSLSSSTVSSKPLPTSTLSSSSSISSFSPTTSPILLTPLSPVPSPTTTSSLASSQATTTLTSTISVVAIIPVPSNATTLTSTISVGTIIIIGNTTFLPTGSGPSYTIIPVTNQASNWRTDFATSWLTWATGVLSTLVAVWVF